MDGIDPKKAPLTKETHINDSMRPLCGQAKPSKPLLRSRPIQDVAKHAS